MEFQILNSKPIITINNEEFVDISQISVRYTDVDLMITDTFMVNEEMTMRPDMLSYIGYGTADYFDYILKFNGISNPFSIDYGDIIQVPDMMYMAEAVSNAQFEYEDNQKDIRDQYINPSKGMVIDPKRIDYENELKKLKASAPTGVKFSSTSVPPNLNQPGATEGKYNKSEGNIKLG